MFSDPGVQSGLFPAIVTLFLFALFRFVARGGSEKGPTLATIAIPLAFLAAYVLILGLPALPPRASSQKLAYVALGGLMLGGLFDLIRPKGPAWLVPLAGYLWPAVIVVWIGWPKLAGYDLFAVFTVVMLWIGGALAFVRLLRLRAELPFSLAPGIMMLVASLGVAGLGVHFASVSAAQLAGAQAAALAAFLFWNWCAVIVRPDGPTPLGRGAVFGSLSVLMGLAAILALYTETSLWALLFLVPVFFAHLVFGERPAGTGPFVRTFRPVLLFIVSSVPLLVMASVVLVVTILTTA